MSSFVGTFEHNLDTKNRFFVPVKFRELIGESFIVRVKLSKFPHIDCFSEEEFEKTVERETAKARDDEEFELLNARSRALSATVTIDSHGRICIPAKILKKARIEKESIFTGMGKYFQIWNSEINEEYYEDLEIRAIEAEDARRDEERKRNEYMASGLFLEVKNTIGV
ncbi:MAG: hypothetical protein IJ262_10910 [Clostridia bacterium]|nr:hypothetical protein [Clostridia bacterium]MBQ8029900.1 hypothetical protein [Clostridia bacterium]